MVVVAIGENVPALDSEQAKTNYRTAFLKLLKAIKEHGQPTIFVRSCFWANPDKDEIMRQCRRLSGDVFVDVGSLGRDPSNAARDERTFPHGGVAGHPGDKGMQALADALLRAMLKLPVILGHAKVILSVAKDLARKPTGRRGRRRIFTGWTKPVLCLRYPVTQRGTRPACESAARPSLR